MEWGGDKSAEDRSDKLGGQGGDKSAWLEGKIYAGQKRDKSGIRN